MKRILEFLKNICGVNTDKYHFTTLGDSKYGTNKLTKEELDGLARTTEWMKEKKVVPITGYILELEKGSFFIHDSGKPYELVKNYEDRKHKFEDSPYTLKWGSDEY